MLQTNEPAVALPVISQGRGGEISDLRQSMGLRAIAKALSNDEEGLKEARSMAHKSVMLAPWDRRNWHVLEYVKSCC